MERNKNVLLAIALSAAVLFLWQYFVATPSMKASWNLGALAWSTVTPFIGAATSTAGAWTISTVLTPAT
jgi:hypothetical protein